MTATVTVQTPNEAYRDNARIRLTGLRLESSYTKPDAYTQAFCVVLVSSSRPGEWVTRLMNAGNTDQYWGHYFPNYWDALTDYLARCNQYGVEP